MSSTGITPLGPLSRNSPLYNTNMPPTLSTEKSYIGINNAITHGAGAANPITHRASITPALAPTPYPHTSYNPHPQTLESMTGATFPLSSSMLQQQAPPAFLSTSLGEHVYEAPATATFIDVLDERKPEGGKKFSSATETSQLRAQVRVLEHELQELRQGLAQNALIGHRNAQVGFLAQGVDGIAAPTARRSKSVPKTNPEIAFNRRVVNPSLGARNRALAQPAARANVKERRGLNPNESVRHLDVKQRLPVRPASAAATATVQKTDCGMVEVPLFASSREIPLQGSAEGRTLLPNSSGGVLSGIRQALDETQLPKHHNVPLVSFSPSPETLNREHCWLSMDSKSLHLPYTGHAKSELATAVGQTNPAGTSVSAMLPSTGVMLPSKNTTAEQQSENPLSLTHTLPPNRTVGVTERASELPSPLTSVSAVLGADGGSAARGEMIANSNPSNSTPPPTTTAAATSVSAAADSFSTHQAALQYMARELAASRQQTDTLRCAVEEKEALCAQLQLRLETCTAELEHTRGKLEALQQKCSMPTANPTDKVTVVGEAQPCPTPKDPHLTVTSSDGPQQVSRVGAASNSVNLIDPQSPLSVQAQLMQAKEEICVLSRKLAAWESWYAKQHQKLNKPIREKRSTREKKLQKEAGSDTNNAKACIRHAPLDTSAFPVDFAWPASHVTGQPTPYVSAYGRTAPQVRPGRKEKNHRRKNDATEYNPHSNIIWTDPLAYLHPCRVVPHYRDFSDGCIGSESLLPDGGFFPDVDRGVEQLIAKERAVRELSSEGRKLAEARLRAVLLAERRLAKVEYLSQEDASERTSTKSVNSSEGLVSQCFSEAPIEVQLSAAND